LLTALALLLAGRRDVGSALIQAGAGPAQASALVRSPVGLAVTIHRPAFLGWLAGAVILAGLMGALAQQFIDAVLGNPAMAQVLGISSGQPLDALFALTQLYVAVIATAYAVHAVSGLRAEEAAGRLEMRLSGSLSRTDWLAAHALVIALGLSAIVLVSSLILAVSSAWSTGAAIDVGRVVGSGLAYLPAELALAGVALTLYAMMPRAFQAAWLVFAATAFVALLGKGLNLPQWALDLSPTSRIGNPPLGTVDWTGLIALSGIVAVLGAVAFAGFRRRGLPAI